MILQLFLLLFCKYLMNCKQNVCIKKSYISIIIIIIIIIIAQHHRPKCAAGLVNYFPWERVTTSSYRSQGNHLLIVLRDKTFLRSQAVPNRAVF